MSIDTRKALHMGRRAYENGLPCRPSKDEGFMAMLDAMVKENPLEAAQKTADSCTKWIDGWQIAKLVEGVNEQ